LLVQVLGPVSVVTDSGKALRFRPAERRLLGTLLLLPGRACSVASLVDAMWGERRLPWHPERAIETLIWRIRLELGSYNFVKTERASRSYVAVLPDGALDLERFTHLLAAADQAQAGGQLAQAVGLMGQALVTWPNPEAGFPDLPDHVPSVISQTVLLARQRSLAVERLADLKLGLGWGPKMIPELYARAESDPGSEVAWLQLMRALIAADRRTEAIANYIRATKALYSEHRIAATESMRAMLRLAVGEEPSAESA
jgi:DNA-binding SARP family transcriptional activator